MTIAISGVALDRSRFNKAATMEGSIERLSLGLRKDPSENVSESQQLKNKLTTVTASQNTERAQNELATTLTTAAEQAQAASTQTSSVSQSVNVLTPSTVSIGQAFASQTVSSGFAVSQYQSQGVSGLSTPSNVSRVRGQVQSSEIAANPQTRSQYLQQQGAAMETASSRNPAQVRQALQGTSSATKLDTLKQAQQVAAYLPAINPGALGFSVRA